MRKISMVCDNCGAELKSNKDIYHIAFESCKFTDAAGDIDTNVIADDILYMLSKIDADDIHMGNFVITKDELKIFDFAGYSGNYDASKDDEMEDSNEQ